ncbi:hypothetical protein AGMMS4952_19570 [Spirochaetia bacterium]|nr:hypothetical protein AGMMS4952_19570 [Spirochaetia bacterium]
MTDKEREENFNYTTTFTGGVYQPIPPANGPEALVPPKGGTGARIIELKVVPIPTTDKK